MGMHGRPGASCRPMRLPFGFFVRAAYLSMMAVEMHLSSVFREFTAQFYQDLMDDVRSEAEMIETVLSPIRDGDERAELRTFIDTITRDDVSDEQLRKLWWSSSADIVFYDGAELRAFLKRVRDRL